MAYENSALVDGGGGVDGGCGGSGRPPVASARPALRPGGNLGSAPPLHVTARIGLPAEGESQRRAFQTLTAQPGLEVEMLEEGRAPGGEWDALVLRDLSPAALPWWDWSLEEGTPVVLASRPPAGRDRQTLPPQATVVSGVLAGENLAAALLGAMGETDRSEAVRLAWTAPGPPLGGGEAVNFPLPTGPLWAGRAPGSVLPEPAVYLAAPTDGPWMGLSAEAGGQTTAVADDADFLRGVFLAAAALTAARGEYPPGWNRPADPAGKFLTAARQMGLEIAAFTPAP